MKRLMSLVLPLMLVLGIGPALASTPASKAAASKKAAPAKKAAPQKKAAPKKPASTNRKKAAAARPDPVLQSPIAPNALQAAPAPVPATRMRTAPERAYAVDGETFFYQGKKYRVDGMPGSNAGEMGMQRLQKALDGGTVNVEELGAGSDGVTRARVRIDGRDLAAGLR